ncbi:hypothetical protein SAMN05428957_106128 [Oryzisolibacter propanilivorax]|uniref:Uncharacterized protein n=2 Tax=Oryzisolibacter propanilivorax TaxID=1527607 RepID=A0A1G9THA6_9BURK|nr:hypothetical protein SAMN05428957_106128 [Oryzisolibacter propanilivorax]
MEPENNKNNPSARAQEEYEKDLPIKHALERYLAAIRSIGTTANITLPHIAKWWISEVEKSRKNIEKHLPEKTEDNDWPKRFTLESAREFAEFSSAAREFNELREQKFTKVLTKSLFTQLFAEFDAFIGELLKAIYLKNDKLLKGISREISLSDLMEFDDINSVKISMLNKEIETFRRDSYIDQFSTLEKKFNIKLRKFSEWGMFVELSQRRNIFTHNGGAVSDQYLLVCEREGYKFENRPKIGEITDVTFEYFGSASRLLSKVGLMLAYTLWSKVFPHEISEIHTALNDTIFRCLQHKRWRFVAELSDFALSEPMRKNISEIDLRIRIINAAIGLKFSNLDDEAKKILNSVDWSASYRDFKLAILVIQEQYDEAIKIMKSIGKSGEIIRQPDYHTWPLFSKFREQPEFYDAYYEVYGEAFAERIETPKGAVEASAKSGKVSARKKTNSSITDITPSITSHKSAISKNKTKTTKVLKPKTSP